MPGGVWIFGFAAIAAAPTTAANPFDGVWRSDPAKVHATAPPIVLDLGGGVLTCRSCRPPYAIRADGGFHPVAGGPDADASAVDVHDPGHLVKTDRLKGRITLKETFAVSPGGRTARVELVDTSAAGAPPRVTEETLTRVSTGSGGVNAISGVWRLAPGARFSANAETLKISGGTLTVTTPDGRSATSSLDGRPNPVGGDPDMDAISVRQVSPRVLLETDTLKGRPVATSRLTLSPDGRSIDLATDDLAQGTRLTQVLRKQ